MVRLIVAVILCLIPLNSVATPPHKKHKPAAIVPASENHLIELGDTMPYHVTCLQTGYNTPDDEHCPVPLISDPINGVHAVPVPYKCDDKNDECGKIFRSAITDTNKPVDKGKLFNTNDGSKAMPVVDGGCKDDNCFNTNYWGLYAFNTTVAPYNVASISSVRGWRTVLDSNNTFLMTDKEKSLECSLLPITTALTDRGGFVLVCREKPQTK